MSSSTLEELLARLVGLSKGYGETCLSLESMEETEDNDPIIKKVLKSNKRLYEQRIEEIKTEIQDKFKAK